MIAFVEGPILFVESGYVVVAVNGLGYQVNLSKRELENMHHGSNASFHIHTNVREDAIELFGFSKREEKQLFQLLISVSGVGCKLAQSIISAMPPSAIAQAIVEKDLTSLSKIPGIGKKTAERLSLELKDKVINLDLTMGSSETAEEGTATTLQQIILNLGFSKDQSKKAISELSESDLSELALEDLVKKSLNILSGKSGS